MKIQVNSDKTVAVDESLMRFVKTEVSRVLDRFAAKLTRVEVHLNDVDGRKSGQLDKRCLIEVRPAGAKPLSVSAKATRMDAAVEAALVKMRRSLTTFFGKLGRGVAGPDEKPAKKVVSGATEKAAVKKAVVKKAVVKKATKKPGPKKRRIYQARRKA